MLVVGCRYGFCDDLYHHRLLLRHFPPHVHRPDHNSWSYVLRHGGKNLLGLCGKGFRGSKLSSTKVGMKRFVQEFGGTIHWSQMIAFRPGQK